MTASLNASDISKYALRLIGAMGHGEDLNGEDYGICLESLNLVLEEIQRKGHIPINIADETVTLVASTATYTLSATDTVDIFSAYVRDDAGIDHKLDIVPYSEYNRIPDKDEESKIPQVMLFKRVASPTITLWPVPNDATVTVVVSAILSTTEATASATTLDIPSALYKPVAYLMAADLAPQYRQSKQSALYFKRLGDKLLLDAFAELSDKWDSDYVPGAYDM